MVKLFVGNLGQNVDADELKALFEQYGTVSECEIIRNFAFVHMDDQQEADKAFENLNNYSLNGRPIHLEHSTSKLRNRPGMDDVCFRCGARDHKTNNCPVHDGVNKETAKKRSAPRDGHPPSKHRANNDRYGHDGYDYRGGYDGHFAAGPRSEPYADDYYGRRPAGPYEDPIIPRPADRLLTPLYEEYLNARERYYYYRDRLERELYAMRRTGTVPPVAPAPPPPSRALGSGYAGAYASVTSSVPSAVSSVGAGLDPYAGRARSPSSIVRYPELYYARQAAAAAGGGTSVPGATVYDYSTTSVSSGVVGTGRSLYDPYP